ncbi:MAG: hypothetical protein U9R32_09640 [Bacteroidota bacterium]|nr:hypothetical protein [Bacteroidota bacterium]
MRFTGAAHRSICSMMIGKLKFRYRVPFYYFFIELILKCLEEWNVFAKFALLFFLMVSFMNKKISLLLFLLMCSKIMLSQPLHITAWDNISLQKQNKQISFFPLYYKNTAHTDSLSKIIKHLIFLDHKYAIQHSGKKIAFQILPEINIYGGSDFLNNDFAGTGGVGTHLKATIGSQLAFEGRFRYSYSALYQYEETFINKHRINHNGTIVNEKNGRYNYYDTEFYLAWSPSNHFIFEGGFNGNHIGQGYRSLFLSDRNHNYPYFKITTNVWHFRYTALWMQLKDIQNNSISGWNDFPTKYSAIHYLNWKINKKWRVGLFEALIWQAKDEQGVRGFEINYLNPIIFFRPVEFTLGSPDNAMMGMDISFSTDNTLIYFQMLLDEFKLDEIKAMNGWWANKQSFQIGWKEYDILNTNGLNSQLEINFIRPFMYTHFSTLQSYGHYNQPLAHPLGANVVEGIYRINYQANRWNFMFHNSLAYYGTDPKGENYGGDVFKDYNTRTQDYDNYIGQGLTNTLLTNHLQANYLIDPVSELQLFAEIGSRLHFIEKDSKHFLYFNFGVTTGFDGRVFDF